MIDQAGGGQGDGVGKDSVGQVDGAGPGSIGVDACYKL